MSAGRERGEGGREGRRCAKSQRKRRARRQGPIKRPIREFSRLINWSQTKIEGPAKFRLPVEKSFHTAKAARKLLIIRVNINPELTERRPESVLMRD